MIANLETHRSSTVSPDPPEPSRAPSPMPASMQIVFYEAPFSSATPVLAALNELDVPHERVRLNLASQDTRKPEFLKLNPNGKVPTLVVNGTPMFEALAILQWLGDTFGVERELWPEPDEPARLEALSWTTWAYVSFGGLLRTYHLASSENVPAELHHAALAEFARAELGQLLAILNRHLADWGHILGPRYSLADLVVGSVVGYASMCGIDPSPHSHVRRWLDDFMARPAVKTAWR